MITRDAIAPAGPWRVTLVEVGASRHPGEWIGPGYPEWAWSPINVVVLRSPEQTVLVDAGPGFTTAWWPFEGIHADTVSALAEAGVTPSSVDTVVLTHLDYDHAGGLLAGTWPDDLDLVFPAAHVVVHEDAIEAARTTDPDAPDNVGTRLLALLQMNDRLVPVGDGDAVTEGITVKSAPGHRIGHMCVAVAGDDPFVFSADTFHNQEHVAHPEWDNSSDDNPETALATRGRVLGELADGGARTAITHGAGPNAFRVARGNSRGFRIVPIRPSTAGPR
jgi:glyoxylase-like metal-dependent hydrolase (beta-lactamase superfamily II)